MSSQLIETITAGILQPFMSFSLPIRLQSPKKQAEPAMAPIIAPCSGDTSEDVVKPGWDVVHAKFEAEYGLDFGNPITRQKFIEVYKEFWQGKISHNGLKMAKNEDVKDEIVVVLRPPGDSKKRARESDDTESRYEDEHCEVIQSPQKKRKVASDDESDGYEDGEDLFDGEGHLYVSENSLEEDSLEGYLLDEEYLDEDTLLVGEEKDLGLEGEERDSGYDS